MVSERSDLRRRYESKQLLEFFGPARLCWEPTLDDKGRPVPYEGSSVEITAEVVAALGREGNAFGPNTVVPSQVARDVALALRGQAFLSAHAEDAR